MDFMAIYLRVVKYVLGISVVIISSEAVNFLPSIQWTPDNPIFKNLKGQTRKVKIDDEIRIWCPKYYTQDIKTTYQLHQSKLYFALYKVQTKEEYDSCDARKGKRLLYCNDPSGRSTADTEEKQIVFLSNPISSSMDPYLPGKIYYFIGTSGGMEKDIDKRVGGKCSSHHMKFAIYVCRESENCDVDVLNGGWSLWKVNQETGLCERNCSNPAPQNGGFPCQGPKQIDCAKIINGRLQTPRTAKEPTTESATATTKKTTKETRTQTSTQQKVNTTKTTHLATHQPTPTTSVPTTSNPTTSNTDSTMSKKDALDKKPEQEASNSDDVTLSMKGAVLTFVGLFILGCIVGIVQVLVILHIRGKRSGKQPEPQSPINHV